MPRQLLGRQRERAREKEKIRETVGKERDEKQRNKKSYYGQSREGKKDVIVSGSNLLSVSWLNKSASLYFPGTLNYSHTLFFFFKLGSKH